MPRQKKQETKRVSEIDKKRVQCKYDLESLVAQIPDDYQPKEIDWGKPVGKEVWI